MTCADDDTNPAPNDVNAVADNEPEIPAFVSPLTNPKSVTSESINAPALLHL